MAVAREATPVSSAADIKQADLDREDLLTIYRNMLITRGIEERGHILYRQGKIPGSFYTGRGNEGASVGIATAMRPVPITGFTEFRQTYSSLRFPNQQVLIQWGLLLD